MTDTEATFLRAIILSHEPRTQAKIYADWLDGELRPKEAARWRGLRKPKSIAYQSLSDVSFWWLGESPAIAFTWDSRKDAHAIAKWVA